MAKIKYKSDLAKLKRLMSTVVDSNGFDYKVEHAEKPSKVDVELFKGHGDYTRDYNLWKSYSR